jgi:hypothetical protein
MNVLLVESADYVLSPVILASLKLAFKLCKIVLFQRGCGPTYFEEIRCSTSVLGRSYACSDLHINESN